MSFCSFRNAALTVLGTLVVVTNLGAAAATAAPAGCFFGVWMINEQLTKRVRAQRGLMVFLAPWGDNGWVRISGISGIDDPGEQSAEFHFVKWDDRLYPVFGSDPRSTRFKRIDDYTFETSSLREDEPDRNNGPPTTIAFSQDCRRQTWTAPQLDRSNGRVIGNDIRVYDKLLPDTPPATGVYFGAWRLNRQESKLSRSPMENETIAIVPIGGNGWAHIAISGGYQTADFQRGIKPAQEEKRPERTMYWAPWDGTPAFSSGYDPVQVTIRQIDKFRFETTFDRIHQPWQEGERGTIVFSPDGNRMTETRSGVARLGEVFQDDIRVYDKVEPADWLGEAYALPRQ